MKCFITGATGFIGNRLVEKLLEEGNEVHLLVRSRQKAEEAFPEEQVHIFQGDLFNKEAINDGMKGCEAVFHLAAYANVWSKDKTEAYKTNFLGTRNILESAIQSGVKKMVFTSSAATLPPSKAKELVDETFPTPEVYLTDYETTKQQAEQLCVAYCEKGLDVVIVNPPRLYGPGFLNKSNSVTIMIKKYLDGTWRFIPGDGSQIGSYVFIEDIVKGHILALKNGVAGERYILGGDNVSYNKFFEMLSMISGKRRRMIHLPFSLMLGVSKFELFMAETFGKMPLITPSWVRRYLQHRPLSSEKAKREIGYTVTPLQTGLEETIKWLEFEAK